MSEMKLILPDPLVKGCVVEASTPASIGMLADDFAICWDTVYSTNERLAPNDATSIAVEIWPDTGRVFWISKAKREVFRLEIKARSIENAYFEIVKLPDFELQYAELIETLRDLVRRSFVPPQKTISKVVVRDSDDSNSDEVLFTG